MRTSGSSLGSTQVVCFMQPGLPTSRLATPQTSYHRNSFHSTKWENKMSIWCVSRTNHLTLIFGTNQILNEQTRLQSRLSKQLVASHFLLSEQWWVSVSPILFFLARWEPVTKRPFAKRSVNHSILQKQPGHAYSVVFHFFASISIILTGTGFLKARF